jgi:hypothetical protein
VCDVRLVVVPASSRTEVNMNMAPEEVAFQLADNDAEWFFFSRASTPAPAQVRERAQAVSLAVRIGSGSALGAALAVVAISIAEVGSTVAARGAVV